VLLEERRVVAEVGVAAPDGEAAAGLQHAGQVAEPSVKQRVERLVRDEVVGSVPGDLRLPARLASWWCMPPASAASMASVCCNIRMFKPSAFMAPRFGSNVIGTDMSSNTNDGSVTQLFALVGRGDEEAAAALWERFVPRLLGLARRTLASHPRLNSFADDVVQSVFASFFAQTRAGQFVLDHRDDVWNLLGVMTVRKARQAIRREMAAKRGSGQVLNEAGPSSHAGSPPVLDAVPTAQLGPEFDLHAEEMLAGLPDELRTLAVLRLMGHTNPEIASQLDWTLRKVERKLQLIRLWWEKEFSEE
jgi:DNA-directed RNA polymerase specialized sigma24 family protein